MSSIKHLEMAAALSAYPHIEIKKSLFSTKAIYTPTHSQVKAYILEYSPSEGERLEAERQACGWGQRQLPLGALPERRSSVLWPSVVPLRRLSVQASLRAALL